MEAIEVCAPILRNQLGNALRYSHALHPVPAQTAAPPSPRSSGDVDDGPSIPRSVQIAECARSLAFNKMLVFSSERSLAGLKCAEECRHTRFRIHRRVNSKGFYCVAEIGTSNTVLLDWTNWNRVTFMRRRGRPSTQFWLLTESNGKVYFPIEPLIQLTIEDRKEWQVIGKEIAALRYVDSLRIRSKGGGHASALRAITSLSTPESFAHSLRGGLLDFYEPSINAQNPWTSPVRRYVEAGLSGGLSRSDLMAGVREINKIDTTVQGIHALLKLEANKSNLQAEMREALEGRSGVVSMYWEEVLAPRVEALSRPFSPQAEEVLSPLRWYTEATAAYWDALASYIRLAFLVSGKPGDHAKQAEANRQTRSLKRALRRLHGDSGLLRVRPRGSRVGTDAGRSTTAKMQPPRKDLGYATELFEQLSLMKSEVEDRFWDESAFNVRFR